MKSSTEYEYLSKSGGTYKKVYSPDNPGPLYLITCTFTLQYTSAVVINLIVSFTSNTDDIDYKKRAYSGYLNCTGYVRLTSDEKCHPVVAVNCSNTVGIQRLTVFYINEQYKLQQAIIDNFSTVTPTITALPLRS